MVLLNINSGGADFSKWQPPGIKVPKQTPQTIISLSKSLDHLAIAGPKTKQQDVWRCPICGTPYGTQEDMTACANEPFNRDVQGSLGIEPLQQRFEYATDAAFAAATVRAQISFLYLQRKLEDRIAAGEFSAANIPDKDLPRRSGLVTGWIAVRTPRGHESMPVARWIWEGRQYESWLIPKQPNPSTNDPLMMATASRTQKYTKTRTPF